MPVLIKVFLNLFLLFTMVTMPVSEPVIQDTEESGEWREITPEELEEYYGNSPTEYEVRINELANGHVYIDSQGQLVPDPMCMPQPDFGTLSGNSLFMPGWDTQDGAYILGSTAIVKVNDELPCVGLSAFHCLNIYRELDGMDLPEYVQSGVLFDVYHPNEVAIAQIAKIWAMNNAECLVAGKDLVAFEADDLSGVNVLPLAQGTCEQGEVIYLYANLISEDENIIDTYLYPCVVTQDDGTALNYILSETYNTNGASGSPLLNNQGEVVGIHIGTNGSIRIGNSAEGIRSQLIEAYEYNK